MPETNDTTSEINDSASNTTNSSSRWTLGRVVTLVAVGLIAFIVILFVLGLLMALGDASVWAPRIQLFRDMFIIVMTVQGILVIAGLAVLIIQLARFVNLLRSEIKPITEDTKASLKTVRTTTEFVGKNTVQPIVTIKSFVLGLGVFLREMFAIRRLLRPRDDQSK